MLLATPGIDVTGPRWDQKSALELCTGTRQQGFADLLRPYFAAASGQSA